MKKHSRILLGALVAVILAGIGACKPTEKTYRKAYIAAKEKYEQLERGEDSTIYTAIRREALPSMMTVGDESMPTKTEIVSLLPEDSLPRETLKRYNVVVGQFKQIFNARSMRDRLRDGNYPGAFIVQTREPLYYVVARVGSSPEEALRAFKDVKADGTMVLRDPLPWILIPAGR